MGISVARNGPASVCKVLRCFLKYKLTLNFTITVLSSTE